MLDASAKPFCPPDTPPTWIRPRHFRITHVELAVTIDIPAERIDGTVAHHVTLLPHGDGRRSLTLDQHDISISAITIDGQPTTFSCADGQVVIAVPDAAATSFVVQVTFTTSKPAKGMFFIQEDAARGRVAMAWTQGAMEDHSFWFPAFDNPNNLSTYRIAIRHRSDFVAIANGEQRECMAHGDGWSTSVYVQEQPHVLYLVNVVVGAFAAVDDAPGPVPITHYVPRGHEAGALAMFRSTAFAIRWLGDYIGVPYVWKRYGHVVVHGFMWGGMENTTLTTITDRGLMDTAIQTREDVTIDSLVVHELVHQWFGDLLTMKAWSDIWLNESFATYLEARGTAAWRASRSEGSEADILALELWANKQHYLDEDGGRYRRPLVTNRYTDAYELFDRVAYEKGSLVLHALRCYLGEERFRAALRLYTERHRHDLVETADWRQAIEDATGEAMDWFFAQWVERAGHPQLKVAWRHDPVRGQVLLDIEQTHAVGNADAVYRLHLPVVIVTATGFERTVIVSDRAKDTFILPAASSPTVVVVDPEADVLATWDEGGSASEWCARLGDPRIAAAGRARAAVALGKCHPTAAIVAALRTATAMGAPELVRQEAIAALGSLRTADARDALLAVTADTVEPRVRRLIAKALSSFHGDRVCAQGVEALAQNDQSELCAGEWLATRGALEHPGASAVLRAWLKKESWNQRVRAAVLRGLGASGEAPAIDDVLGVLADDQQVDAVLAAAAAAVAQLGARHLIARDRVRRALELRLRHDSLAVRAAVASALAQLGDPSAIAAISEANDREVFGNVRRVYREALERLGKAAAVTTTTATLTKRIDELEQAKKTLELRLEALEKRLDEKK